MSKVYVIHEEPDMGYYGGGEVFAVCADPDRAKQVLAKVQKEDCRSAEIAEIEIDYAGPEVEAP